MYILKGGGLKASGSSQLSGAGVTFFLTESSEFAYGPMAVSGSSRLTFSAPTSGPYYGILFYQDPAIGANKPGTTLSGSTQSTVTGVFYFPTTSISYSGSSAGSQGNYLILVADTVTFTGSVTINSAFPGSRSPLMPPLAISVNPGVVSVAAGSTQLFNALVSNAVNPAVTWSIAPVGRGTVNASGLYTAPTGVTQSETVTLTVTSVENPAKSAAATITLLPPVVIGVTPTSATLYGGGTRQFVASVLNTANTTVTWSLNPVGAGTINAAGLYTAPANITVQAAVTVTAVSVADPTKAASATVTLSPPVAVSVAPGTATLPAGGTAQLNSTVINSANAAVTWSLSPAGLGSVSASGLYTAPAVVPSAQTVNVIATSEADPTKTGSAAISLIPLSISVTPASVTLFVSQTQEFSATVTNATNQAVNWSLVPAGIGTVSASGLYTAPATLASQQTVTVVATSQSDGSKSASATITLIPAAVSLTPSTVSLYAERPDQFSATVTNANNTDVTWSITPPGVGTITANGLYTAPVLIAAQQTVTVKATSDADSSKSATATVTLIPIAVSVLPPTATLDTLQTQQFTAMVTNTDHTALVWSLNPVGVGSISATGLYTAPASIPVQQTVTVKAASVADPTKFATATVTLNSSSILSVTPQAVTLTAAQTQQFTSSTPVTWSLSPATAGSINASGLYTTPECITLGQTVTVTATSVANPSQSVSATITLQNANGYGYARLITIPPVNGGENGGISDFPLLISGTYGFLASTANGGRVQNASGYDIIFTSDAAGLERLDHEIESYQASNGSARIWVRVPQLSGYSDNHIYLFYGKPGVTTSPENKAGVWANQYDAVYHMGNDTALTISDSSGNSNSLTASNLTAAAGKLGGGAQFNGTNSFATFPSGFGITPAEPLTVEFWFKSTAAGPLVGQTAGTVPGGTPTGNKWSQLVYLAPDGLVKSGGLFQSQPNSLISSETPFNDGQWHLLTYTWIAYEGYYAMTLDGQPIFPFSQGAPEDWGALAAYFLGASYTSEGGGSWKYFSGSLDEVRLSKAYSHGYEWASNRYLNETSPEAFYSISPENTVFVSVDPSSGSVLYGLQTQEFVATVIGSCNVAVSWSVIPANSGTISAAGVYTAPANIPTTRTVTVIATSLANNTQSGTASVTLLPPVTVTVSPLTRTMTGASKQPFTANVVNAADTSVVWSINPPTAGSITENGLYTAPSQVPALATVTVIATSVVDSSVGSATVSLINAGSFTYHRAIEIDHTKVPNTDQSNFPVLISGTYSYLRDVAHGGKVQSPNGYDISFSSDCDGLERLDYEIEDWDTVTGRFVAWVRLPSVSHTVNTSFYLSYGNNQILSPTDNPDGLWDSGYLSVFHLSKLGAISTTDSVTNGLAGENTGVIPSPGQAGGGGTFDGLSYIITPTPDQTLTFPAITFSAWFNTSTNQGTQRGRLLEKGTSPSGTLTSGSDLHMSGPNGNRIVFEFKTGPSFNNLTSQSVSSVATNYNDGQWHYATGTYDGSMARLYIDGQLNNSTAVSVGGGVLKGFSGHGIGASRTQGSRFTGKLDEARTSTIARSADWIATEYGNQLSPATFYTIFAEGQDGVSVEPLSSPLYGGQTLQLSSRAASCSVSPATWSLSAGSPGSISATGLYTAPASVPALKVVTVTATHQTVPPSSGSASITLLPPASVIVTPVISTVYGGQTKQFAASVANAFDTSVTWSVLPVGIGTMSATGVYTAPATVASQQIVTVKATSVADPVNRSDPSGMQPKATYITGVYARAAIMATRIETMCVLTQVASVLAFVANPRGPGTVVLPAPLPLPGGCIVTIPVPVRVPAPRPRDPEPRPRRRPPLPPLDPPIPEPEPENCNGHRYQVDKYGPLSRMERGGCQPHHVPQDALAHDIFRGNLPYPVDGYNGGPSIILPPIQHLIITGMQRNREHGFGMMIDSGSYSQYELFDQLISQDFDMLRTASVFSGLGELRRLILSVYGR